MIKASVLYPNGPGKKFDADYYAGSHAKMVKRLLEPLGLVQIGIEKGIATLEPGAPAPYVAIGYLLFNTIEEFQKAMETHGAEIMSDIPNYTDIEPQIQISEVLL